jgi:hypothetical protein
LYMLQVFQRHVVSVCSKYFICFQTYVAIVFLSRCCICLTQMLQQYLPNISVVLVLYCGKRFHVASVLFEYFICFTHMLQVHVPNVSLKCFFLCFKCFMCLAMSEPGAANRTRGAPRVLWSGHTAGMLVLS